MPQDLAALLVEEGAVSQADMERAVAQQARLGGGLDTALLELELIGEGLLRSFLAHASELPAVQPGALKEIDPRARRVFPAKVAERHRLAPFALDGRELSVVAAHPVDSAAVDEIGFMLSLTLVPHVGPEWQVHDLIHRLYGGQMPARLARLAERESRRGAAPPPPAVAEPPPAAPAAPAPVVEPPRSPPPKRPPDAPAAAPKPAPRSAPQSLEDAFFAAGDAGVYEAPSAVSDAPQVEWPASPAAPTEAQPAPPAPAAVDESSFEGLDRTPPPDPVPEPEPVPAPAAAQEAQPAEPEPPAALAAASGDDRVESSFADIEPERRGPSGFARDEAEPAEPLLAALELAVDAYDALWAEATPEPAATVQEPPAPEAEAAQPAAEGVPPEPQAAEAGDGEAEEEAEPEPPPRLDRTAPPRWSIEDARATLATAVHRDEVVLTALRFARDFFEFSALFAVTRDAVVGHDALGPEDAPMRARATAIYADDPGIVRTVLETGAPYLGPAVREAAGTINVLDGLWRGTPHTVLLYPILVGDRAVAVLYADNGEAPVSARRLGDLLLFLSTVGGSFERIIRARKKRRRRAAANPPPAAPPTPPPAGPAADPEVEPSPSWMAPPPELAVPIPEASNEPAAEPAVEPSATAAAGAPPPKNLSLDPELPPHPALSPGGGEGISSEAGGEPSIAQRSPPHPTLSPGGGEGVAAAVEAAIALLLGGGSGPPDPVAPIVDLLLDPAPEIAAAARNALAAHRGDAAVKPVPERLRRGLLSGVGARPVRAAEALGALRDVESIPILIQAFEGGSSDGTEAAAGALSRITLQRLGPSAQKWLRWWKENRGRSRAEWLFAALTSPDLDMREGASAELRAIAEPPVRYSPDMSTVELATASRAWWSWWARQGLRA